MGRVRKLERELGYSVDGPGGRPGGWPCIAHGRELFPSAISSPLTHTQIIRLTLTEIVTFWEKNRARKTLKMKLQPEKPALVEPKTSLGVMLKIRPCECQRW